MNFMANCTQQTAKRLFAVCLQLLYMQWSTVRKETKNETTEPRSKFFSGGEGGGGGGKLAKEEGVHEIGGGMFGNFYLMSPK